MTTPNFTSVREAGVELDGMLAAYRIIHGGHVAAGQKAAANVMLSVVKNLERFADRLAGVVYPPADWKLVPIEPTVAMQDEGAQAANAEHGRHDCASIGYGHSEAVYRAMIATAPEPPNA